jgi:hypothetical protein
MQLSAAESEPLARHSHGALLAQSASLEQASYEHDKRRGPMLPAPQRPFEPSVQSESWAQLKSALQVSLPEGMHMGSTGVELIAARCAGHCEPAARCRAGTRWARPVEPPPTPLSPALTLAPLAPEATPLTPAAAPLPLEVLCSLPPHPSKLAQIPSTPVAVRIPLERRPISTYIARAEPAQNAEFSGRICLENERPDSARSRVAAHSAKDTASRHGHCSGRACRSLWGPLCAWHKLARPETFESDLAAPCSAKNGGRAFLGAAARKGRSTPTRRPIVCFALRRRSSPVTSKVLSRASARRSSANLSWRISAPQWIRRVAPCSVRRGAAGRARVFGAARRAS